MSTATEFVEALRAHASAAELRVIHQRTRPGEQAFGIRMKDLFDTAKRFRDLPGDELEALFADPFYEVRMGAFCILDFRAKSAGDRTALYGLYLDHHDAITTWDMVDRAAPSVVGGHLLTHDRSVLSDLASAEDPLRRRTAVTAPLWFVRHGTLDDLADALRVAALVADDPDPLVHLAVGTLLKHVGGRLPEEVRAFVTRHDLPRPAVRAALSKVQ